MPFNCHIKYIYLLLLLVCDCIGINHISAQTAIGVKCGYTDNYINADLSNREYTHLENMGGYSLGIIYKKTITNIFALKAELGLIQKNYRVERSESYTGIYENYHNSYFQLPLTGQIDIFKRPKFSIALNGGAYCAYWVYAKVNGVTPNVFDTSNQLVADGQGTQNFYLTSYSEKYNFNKFKDNRFEFGLQTGGTLQYSINEKHSFFLEYNYYQSFSDIQKKYMVNQKSRINQTFLLSAGFLLRFNKKINTNE